MTVSNTNLRNDYEGNGTQTIFAFTFKVLNEVNQETGKDYTIKVIITDSVGVETEQTEDVDYTVALSEDGTGNITFTTAPLLTESITFLSDIPRTQNTDYINIGTDKFPADSHEGTVDKLTLISQEQDEAISRAVLLPESSQLTGLTIPVSVENADKAIVVNSTGDDLAAKNLADIGTFPVTDFAATLLDDETAAEARTTLEVKAAVDTWSNLGTTSGAANTYTTTASTTSGVRYVIKINVDNTGASTLNGTAMEKFDGAGSLTALEAGDLQQDQNYDILDNGTKIVVFNPQLPYIDGTNFTNTPKTAGDTVQVVNTQTGAVATGTTQIPADDTIPQNTEGDQYMSLAVTPTNSSNKLKIDVSLIVASSAAAYVMTAALFQDSTSDSLAAAYEVIRAANDAVIINFIHFMTAGTASSTTFKVRAGTDAAGTTTFNGAAGSRGLGGVLASSITITEIQV